MNYPIIERRRLAAVPSRLLRTERRELSELPVLPAGADLVAEVDGAFVRLPGRLRGSERELVNASSVIAVDTRPNRTVEATIALDSKQAGEAFAVRIAFACSVLDAALVASHAPDDLIRMLEDHLRSDDELLALGQEYEVVTAVMLRQHVHARVRAFCLGRPPRIPGMSIDLTAIELDTPADLREHARSLREEQRRQELERLRDEFGIKQAKLIEEVLSRGPKAAEALALKLNEARFQRAADRAYTQQDRRLDQLVRVLELFGERGGIDTFPLDTSKLVDTVLNQLVADASPGVGTGGTFALGDGAPAELMDSDGDDTEAASGDEHPQDDVPDEDELGD
jgi:hypothetical protein